MKAERDLGHHIGELLLHELGRRQRLAESVPGEGVVARRMPTELGRAERAPGNAVTRIVEAGKGTAQTRYAGEEVGVGNEDLVHHDLAGDRRAQAELALDLRRRE